MFFVNSIRLIKFNIIFLIIISFFVFTQKTSAYDQEIAHPNIAKMAAETYNKQYDKSLSNEDIELIMQGAYEEDTPIRWLNHFYDPVYNEGLLFGNQYPTSKTWATDSEDQSTYGMGDKSWYRAIEDYKNGDRVKALKALGHTIHLISDLGVPAHTRNDVHADEISYEDFVKENWQNIYNNLDKNFNTREVNNLDQAFDELANYSNNNFYTRDTLESSKYKIIEVTGYEKVGKFIFAKNNNVFLYRIIEDKNFGTVIKEFNYGEVFNNNAQHLIPKAVEYSAGVIKLFFDEVEKDTNVSLSSHRSKWFTTNKFVGSLVSGTIAIKDVSLTYWSGLKYFGEGVNNVLAEGQTSIKSAYEETLNSVQNNLSKITFDQILTTLPNIIVANSTQITNLAQPSQLSPPIKNSGELLNTVVEPVQNITKLEEKIETKLEPIIEQPKKEEHKLGEFSFVFGAGGQPNKYNNTDTHLSASGGDNVDKEEPPSDEESLPNDPLAGGEDEDEEEESLPGEAEGEDGETTTTEDIIEETSTSTEPIIEAEIVEEDNTPPNPPELNLSFGIATSTTSTMNIDWNNSADDLAYYNLEYKLDGEDWAELATSTTSTAKTIVVENFKKYFVRVNAVDINNNTSDWTEKSALIDYPKTVVINEIAWMGMGKSRALANDEWIELYNNTNQTIDLSDWSLTVSGKPINWNKINPVIQPKSYYLLERTDDNTVADILADAIFTVSYGLGNDGEDLILIDNTGQIIDQVDNSSGWFAGENEGIYKTMERIDPFLPSNWKSNWQTADSIPYKGLVQGGARIYGSPRMPNMGYWYLIAPATYYDTDADNSLTLTKANSPYIFDSMSDIPADFTLIIEPGVVLVGVNNDAVFEIDGEVQVNGTEDDPVYFTSRKDVNNFDCVTANFLFNIDRDCNVIVESGAKAGDWSRISVREGGSFEVDNVKFLYGARKYYQYGGGIFNGKFPSHVINNIDGEISISNSSFEFNYINPDEDKREYDAIINVEADDDFAIATLNNVVFDGGHRAVNSRTRDTSISITNSEFKNFTSEYGPTYFRFNLPELENITFTSNTKNAYYLYEVIIDKDETLKSGNEYIISYLQVNSSSTLDIEEGVVISMWKKGNINVDGVLNINGIAENPVNILPLTSGENWGGIIFNNSTSTINYTNLIEGGLGTVSDPTKSGMIVLNNSNVEINNSKLTNARRPYNMVYSKNSNLSLKDSLISWDAPQSNSNWYITGIVLNGGHLSLDNTYFNEMSGAIVGSLNASAEATNMTLGHFTNIENIWKPIDLLSLL